MDVSLTDIEIVKTIERLLRAQPRNRDVILICGELHARIVAERAAAPVGSQKGRAAGRKVSPARPDTETSRAPTGDRPAFDRKAYQRELMRKRRAEGKA